MTDHFSERHVNRLRLLASQMITTAGSGHPGIALGAAPMLYTLYAHHLVVDPTAPDWHNRDRFVLSAGHGSALLYSMLSLAGFGVDAADLAAFRQVGSRTPGHPEVGVTPGVEATTGPLGQGLGMAVGMALAEARAHAQAPQQWDHYTYALVGDGDLMEGVSHEVASFAGQQRLRKLIVLYDDNAITLDGPKQRSDQTDQLARFRSYGWSVLTVPDGDDLAALDAALTAARQSDKPTLIAVQTVIGNYGPYAGTHQAHGKPLTPAQLADLACALDLPLEDTAEQAAIQAALCAQLRARAQQRQTGTTPLEEVPPVPVLAPLTAAQRKLAGRQLSQLAIQQIAAQRPDFWGGAADLAGSTNAAVPEGTWVSPATPGGVNVPFGVREFGMGTMLNGMALHHASPVFGATFLAFSDYLRPAIRLSALQKLPVVYVFTHDSVTVGPDGPTHQPVEQLMSLRLLPNVQVLRPGTPDEVLMAWQKAVATRDQPTVLVLSRGPLADCGDRAQALTALTAGAAVIRATPSPAVTLVATGTEVACAQRLADRLPVATQVVSMPDMGAFLRQTPAQQAALLPPASRIVVLEAGATLGWQAVAGRDGLVLGITDFGASGPVDAVLAACHFTDDQLLSKITAFLNR